MHYFIDVYIHLGKNPRCCNPIIYLALSTLSKGVCAIPKRPLNATTERKVSKPWL